jgi:hypothetical protein
MNRKMNFVLVLLATFAGMVMAVGFTSCGKKGGGAASDGSKSGAVSDTPKREANGQYRIGSKVQVYDGDFKPTDAYFTYFPDKPTNLNYDNTVILNFGPPYIDAALFLGKSNVGDANSIGYVRNCIDKSIDWAATAKQNNVRSLAKEIELDGYDIDNTQAVYGLNQPNYNHAQVFCFIFHSLLHIYFFSRLLFFSMNILF